MTHDSTRHLLAMHAVRVLGFAETREVARRFELGPAETTDELYDAEARGWVTHAAFGDLKGWSLTELGRAENERQLAAELASVGGAEVVRQIYRDFLPLNARLQRACTDWQLRPGPGGRLVSNAHVDRDWDAAVLEELTDVNRALVPIVDSLGGILTRFREYDTRFTHALRRALAGDGGWVDRTDIDSCHRVWFELHEDLIATLGIDRQARAGLG